MWMCFKIWAMNVMKIKCILVRRGIQPRRGVVQGQGGLIPYIERPQEHRREEVAVCVAMETRERRQAVCSLCLDLCSFRDIP